MKKGRQAHRRDPGGRSSRFVQHKWRLRGEVTRPPQDVARPLRGDFRALAPCPLVGTAGGRGQWTLLAFELRDGAMQRAPVQSPVRVEETTVNFNSLPHPKD